MPRLFAALVTVLALLGPPSFAQTPIGSVGPLGGLICDTGQFALCTSAPCIPDPSDPTSKAICNCVVESGANYGIKTSCAGREPQTVSGTTSLVSTYSFGQAAAKKVIKCEAGSFWTDCLDMPCVVDPRDPTRAICTCLLKDSGPFVTYSDTCDTGTCGTGYWSAATLESFEIASAALMDTLGYTAKPYAFCEPRG